jgi:DNA polymerase (family 10)
VIEAAACDGHDHRAERQPVAAGHGLALVAAREGKGVKCAINPDAHHTSQLNYLWFGIGAARKGWLTRKDVVNCLPLSEIQAVLAGKRARHQS